MLIDSGKSKSEPQMQYVDIRVLAPRCRVARGLEAIAPQSREPNVLADHATDGRSRKHDMASCFLDGQHRLVAGMRPLGCTVRVQNSLYPTLSHAFYRLHYIQVFPHAFFHLMHVTYPLYVGMRCTLPYPSLRVIRRRAPLPS